MQRVVGRAWSRVGLLGNPSDGYEGRAIACSVRNFGAEVTIEPAERLEIVPGPADRVSFDDLRELSAALARQGSYGGLRLVRAAIARFVSHSGGLEELSTDDPRLRFRLDYTSDIPRQAGLSGSSAIVIAVLRALARWFERELAPGDLAELALAAEAEDLGIAAGPMDRVIQSYEGVMAMDFAPPRSDAAYRRLDPELLPPLFIAWDPEPGTDSGRLHGGVRTRWLSGDPEVLRAVELLRAIVERGERCLADGDREGFRGLMDENFDVRATIFPMREHDIEMVEIGRAAGAAVKFAGSGGAVVGALRSAGDFDAVAQAYADRGYPAARPFIVPE